MMENGASKETNAARPATRIQQRNRATILDAALNVFSAQGFRGATIDQIAIEAGLSKPNLLYYFPSKEAMHNALLSELLVNWLAPLKALDPDGEPLEEILAYVHRKLQMSRSFPRESRLFANEIVQGAPRIQEVLSGELKSLVDEKAAVVRAWVKGGKIADVDPYHLMFSIWSLTQHYADFDAQVCAILDDTDPFPGAENHLNQLFSKLLSP